MMAHACTGPKPLQVNGESSELEQLERFSRARGWTKSQAVRVAVRALVRSSEPDPLLRGSGMIEGLPEDLSANFAEHLEETFVVQKTKKRAARRASAAKRLRR